MALGTPTTGETAAEAKRLWRETAAEAVGGIVAMIIYAALAPTRIVLVQLPLFVDDSRPFGLQEWGWFIVALVAGPLAGMLAWSLVGERRLPRFRRNRKGPQARDWSLTIGFGVAWFSLIFHPDLTQGLLIEGEHVGAYVWAPAEQASWGIWLFGVLASVVAIVRIAQLLRARWKGRNRKSASLPAIGSTFRG